MLLSPRRCDAALQLPGFSDAERRSLLCEALLEAPLPQPYPYPYPYPYP